MLPAAMRAAVLAFTLVLLVPIAASAQAKNQKEAEQHFNTADKLYKAGDYQGAVKEFLTAYTLVPVNPLLFNIGQAYRLSGEREKALSYYEKYVSFEPNGAQVPDAKKYIQELKTVLETEKREREAREAEQRQKDEAAAAARAEEERKQKAAELARKRADAASAGSGLRTAGLVIGGLGVVGVGAGIAIGASSKFDGKAIAITGVGGAALVTGIVLYVIGANERSNAEAALQKTSLILPQIGEHSFGLAWLSTF
jgi:tetratricopeptide (TPR) repeat protein